VEVVLAVRVELPDPLMVQVEPTEQRACAALAWTLLPPWSIPGHRPWIDGYAPGGDADCAASPMVPPKPCQDQVGEPWVCAVLAALGWAAALSADPRQVDPRLGSPRAAGANLRLLYLVCPPRVRTDPIRP
jgi:hypothetical protein